MSADKCNCDFLPSGGMEWNPKCPLHGERGTHSQQRVVRRKRTYRNTIRFNCSNYHRLLMTPPANCYNCMARDGYPQNLGGDKNCANFAPNSVLGGTNPDSTGRK